MTEAAGGNPASQTIITPVRSEAVMKSLAKNELSPISRRTLLIGGLVAGAASLQATTGAKATARVSQAAVHLQTASDGAKNCGACKHFMGPSACRFVEGPVSSNDYCWIWAGKVG
jgi:hypothetical protein